MTLCISVLISTHNPNMDRLERTLKGIAEQTLNSEYWELVIVDNASTTPLSVDGLAWTRGARRVIREERLGLAYGRLAGIRNSTGALLVFVDDDNVLTPGYLENATKIFSRVKALGVAGGIVEPDWCDGEP